jgi:serine/threonine protein kinase
MMASGTIPREVGEYRIESDIVLGAGTDATVLLATHVPSETRVAVKVMYVANSTAKRERAMFEVHLLRQLSRHDYIIDFFDFVDMAGFIFVFLEYAPYGDLGSFIHKHGRLEEELARKFFVQILSAVDHCHSNSIAHHDLKLENILLAADYSLRLIDFGLSRRVAKECPINEFAGSPLYMPPEIFSVQPHDQQVDVWSLGVCLYYMVTDLFPFPAETYHELAERVLFDDLVFPTKMGLTEPLQDLIRGMLHKDPKQRITLALIRKHPWLRKKSLPQHHHAHHSHSSNFHRSANPSDWNPDAPRDPGSSPR